MQGKKEGCRPCGLHITATDIILYVRDKYFSVDVHEEEEAGRQAEENPCGLANRDTYSCGHIRDTGEENGNPLQYSSLGNPMGREAWWARVHGVAKCWTQLSDQRTTSMLEIQISVHMWKEGANPCGLSITGIDFCVWLVATS